MGAATLAAVLMLTDVAFSYTLHIAPLDMPEPPILAQADPGAGDVTFNQGMAAFQAHQYETAIAHWQQSLNHYRQNHHPRKLATTLNAIAAAYLALGDTEAAIAQGESALALALDLGDQALESNILGNLGIAHANAGRYGVALTYYEQAQGIMQSRQDGPGEAQILGLLGNVYEALGDYEAAIAAREASLALAERFQAVSLISPARLGLGNLYRYQGGYDAAIDQYTAAIALARDQQDGTAIAHGLNNLGIAYQQQGQPDAAIAAYAEGLTLAQTGQNLSLQASILTNLSVTQAHQGDGRTALATRRQAVALARSTPDPRLLATTLNNLAHALLAQGELPAAEAALQEAIALLDDLRQGLTDANAITLFDTQIYTYNLLTQVYVAQGDFPAALEASELGRSRVLLDQVARGPAPTPAFTPDQMRHLAQTLDTTLVEYALVPEEPFTAQGRQRGNAAQLYIWVILPSGEIQFRQQSLENINLRELVTASRQAIGVQGRAGAPPTLRPNIIAARQAAADQTLGQLYALLIAPIADLLPTDAAAKVTLIPQEELLLVPFPALKTPAGDYLIAHHTLTTAPSMQVLYETQQRQQQLRASYSGQDYLGQDHSGQDHSGQFSPGQFSRWLIVGNPTMPAIWQPGDRQPVPLPSLPYAAAEARTIGQLFSVQPLLGATASEARVKQAIAAADIIHLATHGLLDYGDPQASGVRDLPGAIALAPGDGEDGLLTSAEILTLELRADLVVLSACDTGLGTITGDGVVGLSRALMAAGAPSVMVSLWSVPDAATSVLMQTFYRQWQSGLDKAQALRQAMLITQAEYPEPSSWAAFTLIGAMK